jgi:predicted nuclease with TOPRIM domain
MTPPARPHAPTILAAMQERQAQLDELAELQAELAKVEPDLEELKAKIAQFRQTADELDLDRYDLQQRRWNLSQEISALQATALRQGLAAH